MRVPRGGAGVVVLRALQTSSDVYQSFLRETSDICGREFGSCQAWSLFLFLIFDSSYRGVYGS